MAGKTDMWSGSRRTRQEDLLSEINVTPMVDVMLVLLIIFIVTGQIVVTGTEVDLPDARAKQLASIDEPIEVTVDAEQKITLGETVIAPEDFAPTMSELALASPEPEEQRVFVRADRALAYGQVMEIVSQISEAGFTKVAFISNPAGAPTAVDAP